MKSPQPSPSARRSRRPERFRLRPLSLSVPRKELHRELTRLAAAREIPGSRGPGAGGCIYWTKQRRIQAVWSIDYTDAETSNLYLLYALKYMHFISTDVAAAAVEKCSFAGSSKYSRSDLRAVGQAGRNE
jgi:hypothetical protein